MLPAYSANRLIWTFAISPGHVFSSGWPVQAEDVALSLQRAVSAGGFAAMAWAPLGLGIHNADRRIIADGASVRIELPEGAAWPLLLPMLSSNFCSVIEKATALRNQARVTVPDSCDHDADPSVPVFSGGWLQFNSAGSGPFEISDAVRSDSILLRPNIYHRHCPHQSILIRHISSSAEQISQLQSGDINIARNPPPSVVSESRSRATTKEKASLTLLAMNVADPLLQYEGMRKAIRLCIDARQLAKSLGAAPFAVQQGFCPSVLRESSVSPVPDVKQAAQLVKDANRGSSDLYLDHIEGAPRSYLAELVANQIAQAGFKIRLRPASGRDFLRRLAQRKHQLALLTWDSDYPDPFSNAQTFCVNNQSENDNDDSQLKTLAWYNRWHDKELSAAALAAAAEADKDARKSKYDALERDLVSRGPYVFLLEQGDAVAWRGSKTVALGAVNSFTRYPH
jgi:peptide/nickel transport system substrate-binding protein